MPQKKTFMQGLGEWVKVIIIALIITVFAETTIKIFESSLTSFADMRAETVRAYPMVDIITNIYKVVPPDLILTVFTVPYKFIVAIFTV